MEENINKPNNKIKLVIVSVITIAAAFSLAYFISKQNNKNDESQTKETKTEEVTENNNQQNKQEEQQESENENPKQSDNTTNETEIRDKKLIEELSIKTSAILTNGYDTTDDEYININSYYVSNYKKISNLNEDDKAYIAFHYNFDKNEEIEAYKNEPKLVDYLKKEDPTIDLNSRPEYDGDNIYKVKTKYILDTYKDLFGTELKVDKELDGCPSYIIYINDEYSYIIYRCGGYTDDQFHLYKNKFTFKDDKAYVYVSIGESKINNDNNQRYIYYDFLDEINESSAKNKQIDDDFAINKNNYKDFTQYKLTFKKSNNGTYYYEKIEKIK